MSYVYFQKEVILVYALSKKLSMWVHIHGKIEGVHRRQKRQ